MTKTEVIQLWDGMTLRIWKFFQSRTQSTKFAYEIAARWRNNASATSAVNSGICDSRNDCVVGAGTFLNRELNKAQDTVKKLESALALLDNPGK